MSTHNTMVVLETARLGYICTCGAYFYQSVSAEDAVTAARHHSIIVHADSGK